MHFGQNEIQSTMFGKRLIKTAVLRQNNQHKYLLRTESTNFTTADPEVAASRYLVGTANTTNVTFSSFNEDNFISITDNKLGQESYVRCPTNLIVALPLISYNCSKATYTSVNFTFFGVVIRLDINTDSNFDLYHIADGQFIKLTAESTYWSMALRYDTTNNKYVVDVITNIYGTGSTHTYTYDANFTTKPSDNQFSISISQVDNLGKTNIQFSAQAITYN